MAYLNLGTSLIALGRCQEAASVLREGSRLDGTGLRDRIAHENARIASLLQLGGLYADQGKLQRALAVYREALHTLPDTYPPQVGETFYLTSFPQYFTHESTEAIKKANSYTDNLLPVTNYHRKMIRISQGKKKNK